MRELKLDNRGHHIEAPRGLNGGLITLEGSVNVKGYSIEHRPAQRWTFWSVTRGGQYDGHPFDDRDGDVPAGPWIVANDLKYPLRNYVVGVRDDDIYLELANTVQCCSLDRVEMTDAAARALAFSNRWGLLVNPIGELPLAEFLKHAVEMRRVLDDVKRQGCLRLKRPWRLAPLVPRVDPRGSLILSASSLLAFCWLELVQAVQGGADFCRCGNPRCKTFRRYPKTGRPPEYCSEACRRAASRARVAQRANAAH